MVPVFFIWLEKKTKWKVFDFLPAIIWIFLTSILLCNLYVLPGLDFSVIPRSSDVYDTFRRFAVPMFIVLMLLDIDIKRTLSVAWRGTGVLVIGAAGVAFGCVVASGGREHGGGLERCERRRSGERPGRGRLPS